MTLEEIKELSELRLQSEQKLQVENERLRAALEQARNWYDYVHPTGIMPRWYIEARALR